MIRKLGEFNSGNSTFLVFCDEETPLARIDKIDYMFRPPKIDTSCIYFRVRKSNGIIIEPPVDLRLKLTGNIIDIPDEEIIINGVENYLKHQLFDFRVKFCVTRAGFYDLYYSDKRKDEWILITNKIFIPGIGKSEYIMTIGCGWPSSYKGSTTRLYFNVYNSEGTIDFADIPVQGFFIEDFGYTNLGKYRLYVDVSADQTTEVGLTGIIFRRDDFEEFKVYFYNKETDV